MDQYYDDLQFSLDDRKKEEEEYVKRAISEIEAQSEVEKPSQPGAGGTSPAPQEAAPAAAEEEPKSTRAVGYDQKRGSVLEGIGGLFGEQGRRFGEFVDDMVNAPAKGVLDTVFDAAGLIPGLKGLDAWWDKSQKPVYDKEHGLVTATRKISGIVIPSIIGGGAITQGGKAVAGASKINALARLEKAGTIAAHIGADVGVTAISSQSVEDENLGEALEDWLGVNIPWATRAGDSPDVRRQKHILEAAGMNVASELLQGIFALRRGTKVVPTNQAAAEALDGAEEVVPVVANNAEEVRAAAKAAEKVDPRIAKLQAEKSIYEESLANHKLAQDSGDVAMQLDDQTLTLYADRLNKIDEQLAKLDSDPVVRAMDDAAEATAREQTDEAIRRVNADPNGEKGYDAFINTPAEPEARAVINTDVNPHLAAVDHAVIQRNIGTTAGRARAAVTNGQLKYMQAAPGSQRAEDLKQFFDSDVADGLAAVVDGKRLSAADVKSSVDRLVESVFDMGDNGMDDYVRTIQGMKDNVYQGIKYFGEENWVIASQAFRKAFDQVFDPNVKRASAIVTQQMGDDIADTARAANIIGEVADTSRQQEIVLERLETLASEIRVNQYIAGRTLEYKKLVKNGKPEAVAEFLEETGATMAAQVDKAKEGAKKLVNTLRAIKEKNPELLKPFMYAYDLTNGKVDEIHKLNRFAEQHVGLFNKMIYDDMPEVPSMLLEQLNAVRYNNVLSGLSAIRAAAGNATNLVMKPVNALVGSLARGKFDEFKRIHAVYGGVHETFTRAMKHMGNEWKFALDDYDGAMMRGRADLNLAKSNDIEFMESMADVWRQNGEIGKVAKWNITKSLKWWNGKLINRYGTTAMYALDGFVKSALATASARAQAYDDLIRSGAHQLDNFQQAFIAKSGQLYDEAFDSTGLLTDKAAKIASGEISLNLDNKLVSSLEGMMKQYPALRTVFMFPRTGANALELSWSYMPSAPFNAAIGKQRKVFKAVTREMKMEALMEHGIEEFSEAAFEAIKSEYIGRQVMGGAVMMGIGMMAFNGQVTGNGPQDAAEKRRMIEMGWQPKSIRVGDRWVSYQGLEPFDTLMSLTADVIYQANRVDQSVTEDWMRKLSFAISANLTSKTFLSGLQPLTDIIAGNNEAALARFTANFADSMLPLSGARHVFARMVKPQLQDVENDFLSYMQNYNRYLPAADAALEDYIDVYTGKPINNFSPMESAWNALMPFFKTSFGTEPWREWLLNTGWDGLQKPRVNVNNGEPLEPSTRQWINNYVATYGGLAQKIEEMRTRPDGFWDKKMKEYSKLRGMQEQSAVPIKEWVVHQELDRIHDEAFQEAWRQWEIKNADEANIGLFKESTKRAMNIGDAVTAERSIQSTQNLIDYYRK